MRERAEKKMVKINFIVKRLRETLTNIQPLIHQQITTPHVTTRLIDNFYSAAERERKKKNNHLDYNIDFYAVLV